MDLHSELSATQPAAQHQRILVSSQGDPLKINLQAVELEGRPKLVRTLKSAGALVVSNAKEAAIILVDSTTESGKRLIRTWGHDASKVVLEHTWVRTSVDAGRPLLEADNWGSSMTIDDGKPVTIDGVVVDEDELDEVEALVTNPLPTPRVTPVDHTSQGPEMIVEPSGIVRSEPNTSAQHGTVPLPQGPPIALPAAVGVPLPEDSMADVKPPLHSPPPPPATQPLPYSQPTLFAQPSQSQNTYAYTPFATQQAYPSLPQMMPTQPFQHASSPTSQPQHAPSAPHTPLPSVQSPTQMTSNATPLDGLNLQNPNLATIMTIMEVVRHMDQSSWFGQNQLPVSQSAVNPSASKFTAQPTSTSGSAPSTSRFQASEESGSPAVDASFSSSQGHASDTATSSWKHGSVTEASEGLSITRSSRKIARRPSNETPPPSISRKRPPAVKPTNPPSKRLRKGKERVLFSDSSEGSEVDEPMEASDDACSTHSSASSPAQPRSVVACKKRGEIFLSDSGQPLRFFVQVDLHGRHTVVTNIKKNQGKIVNNIADADYMILFARSDTFQGLLSEAIALGKSPILAAFVTDCIEEGALLDETDYILESATKVRALKRGRQNAFSVKVETPRSFHSQTTVAKSDSPPPAEECRKSKGTLRSSTYKKPRTERRSAPSKPAVKKKEDSTTSHPPTPPPASTRQLMSNGKYLFTEVEDKYFLRLAKHYLSRDPTTSNTALVVKLHEQMPHHSTGSWAAHIDRKLKGVVEDIRKRANIAKRKRNNEAANRNVTQGLVNGETSMGHPSGTADGKDGVPLNQSPPSQKDLEREDFDVITHFFASGGGDDDDDERVWQKLEKHQQCRSASSWPEYYAAHQKEVYSRIEELMNECAGD